MHVDAYWVGLISGLFVGILGTLMALSPTVESPLLAFGSLVMVVGSIRLMVWLSDKEVLKP